MNNDDYAALVALDWGNTEHAYALRMRKGTDELGSIPATAEDLHGWLEQLGARCGQQPVALALEGYRVRGIDISPAMVGQLRAKPGGAEIHVTIGDIATTRVPGEFDLVYIPFNTITNLPTQDEQVACFLNAAAHLRPGGYFVIEVFVPELLRLNPGEKYLPFEVKPEHLGFDEYDLLNQLCISNHYYVREEGMQYFQTRHRYAWPAEYDLMARLAGLTLHARYADWRRSTFTAESTAHISVWQKPAESNGIEPGVILEP